ncbi:MAG TPA: hypothetical protein VML55_11530 [Planctomycetaceae bacterium]|nr:hypothetical protein [Planctomycetaceae bacterium]
MSTSYRRYERLLPLKFNDGTAVPRDLVIDTALELEERFGAVSTETQEIQGQWRSGGQRFSDQLVRLFVDVEDLVEHREFLLRLKEQLKVRFQQLEIWLTSYPIDVL